ncbi:RsiV family protein [Limibacterium fermenti]|uniref:RsiV family protein n=1 Tax=Limibacterium fermenti TaxID=3229863 RepID=UPI000E874D83|nr:hypothetical protein [Porphyromonadaceae bacterium]HBX45595.1 hypothetical protein [Porphyromonadaceae bacterium]
MSRQSIIPVTLLMVSASILLFSCNESKRSMFKADNKVEFDTIITEKQYHLEGDTANPSCNLHLAFVYPVGSGKADLAALQRFFVQNVLGAAYDSLSPAEAVEKYTRDYVDNYLYDVKVYRENVNDIQQINARIPDMHADDSEHAVMDTFYSYYEILSDSVVYNRHDILAFQVKQSNNKGGVASYDSYRNCVINLKTETLLTENDIFNAGYDVALQSLFVTYLLEQNNVKTVRDLEDLGFFGVEEMLPNGNFLVTDKGIIYTFNKGEYSAYQLHAPEVFIPYDAIRSLLRNHTVVSKLAGL